MKKTGFLRGAVCRCISACRARIRDRKPGRLCAGSRCGSTSAAPAPVWHYFGAAIGLGMIVMGAALGIGKFAAAAAESIARQPAAAAQISGAVNLPLFLLEGVAIIAEVVVLLIVLLK